MVPIFSLQSRGTGKSWLSWHIALETARQARMRNELATQPHWGSHRDFKLHVDPLHHDIREARHQWLPEVSMGDVARAQVFHAALRTVAHNDTFWYDELAIIRETDWCQLEQRALTSLTPAQKEELMSQTLPRMPGDPDIQPSQNWARAVSPTGRIRKR